MEYNVIGIQCRSDKRLCSPPVSIFVKSQCGLVEIMHHWDECKEKESHIDEYWVIHAVLARCLSGPKTHDINEGTRRRTEHRYSREPFHRFAFTGESRHNVIRMSSFPKVSWTTLRHMKKSLKHPVTLQWVYPRVLCSDLVCLKFEF